MKLLIDGDIAVYRGGYAAERTSYFLFPKGDEDRGYVASFRYMKDVNAWIKYWGHSKDDFTIEKNVEVQPLSNALNNVKHILQGIMRDMESDDYIVYLSPEGKNNFRYTVAVTHPYKGKRKEKPYWYSAIRKYLIKDWGAVVAWGQEADDALGIEQFKNLVYDTDPDNDPSGPWLCPNLNYYAEGVTCICTIDKDLNMIPGWHYNFVDKEQYWVSEDDAIRNFYRQLLTGDGTDNIYGIKGLGKVTAAKIFPSDELIMDIDMYETCLSEYKRNGLSFTRLLENAQLLWIRREEKELWQPPES